MEHFLRELMVAHGGSAAQGSTRLSERFTAGSCSKSWDVPLAGRGDAGDAGPSVGGSHMVGPEHGAGPGEQVPRGAPGRRTVGQAASDRSTMWAPAWRAAGLGARQGWWLSPAAGKLGVRRPSAESREENCAGVERSFGNPSA